MKINPIVEYAQLDYAERKRSDKLDIFEKHDDHSYWGAIVNRLQLSYGIYIFYDSLTRPLYVGIAKEQVIWTRANQSFNDYRERNGKMMYVQHPSSRVKYEPNKIKRVVRSGYRLSDVATFFSAYEIERDNISGLEAFAIRAFGGVLLNTKMEGNGGFGLGVIGEVSEPGDEE